MRALVICLAIGAAYPAAGAFAQDPPAAETTGTSTAATPAAEFRPQALADALAAFRHSAVHHAYDTGPLRLFELTGEVTTFQEQLAALLASDKRPSPGLVADLETVEQLMVEYLGHGTHGRLADMQKTVWRFLWLDNTLPFAIINPRD